ncbi:MAG: Gfo/Idh/MocA family oxidoreductase [Enterococcus aquimarinus]
MTIKYGIISTATIVPRFVAGIVECADAEVWAIAAREQKKAQKMADALKIPHVYASYAELFLDEEIDVVYIATYNRAHYAVAKEALLAGKSVLLEKPFTLTLDEAEDLFALAQAQGVFLMEAQKALFYPLTQTIKTLIADGEIGEVKYLDCRMMHTNADHIPWFKDLASGGGALYGSGSYPIEYFQYVTEGKIEEVAGTAMFSPDESDSQCDVSILFKEGFQGHLLISTLFEGPSELTIYGTKGRIHLPDFWKKQTATIIRDQSVEEITFAHQSEFVYEIAHVNQCLQEGLQTSPIATPDRTMQCVELVEKMYQQWLS